MTENKLMHKGRKAMSVRFWLALWSARLLHIVLKVLHRKGSCLPGQVAIIICPDFLKYISKPAQIIAVTGTNGKTTLCNMLCDMLESDGKKVLHNRAGSNTDAGISTALLKDVGIFNRSYGEMAVLEVDECWSPKIFSYLTPDYIVVTNLSRDSITRNAHPQFIADLLSASIPEKSKLILNGDDPFSMNISPKNPRVYFGIRGEKSRDSQCLNLCNDFQICPVCAGKLKYEYRHYFHFGRVSCTRCSFSSPRCDYIASDIDFTDMKMRVSDNNENGQYKLLADNLFSAYNTLSAVAMMRELGYDHSRIVSLMGRAKLLSSRYATMKIGDVDVVFCTAKGLNAASHSLLFDHIRSQPGRKELLWMANVYYDANTYSENMCWYYDCDFEFLADAGIEHIVITGPRAQDLRLRLLLAGVPEDIIEYDICKTPSAEKLELSPGRTVYIIYPILPELLWKRITKKIIKQIKEEMDEN